MENLESVGRHVILLNRTPRDWLGHANGSPIHQINLKWFSDVTIHKGPRDTGTRNARAALLKGGQPIQTVLRTWKI